MEKNTHNILYRIPFIKVQRQTKPICGEKSGIDFGFGHRVMTGSEELSYVYILIWTWLNEWALFCNNSSSCVLPSVQCSEYI